MIDEYGVVQYPTGLLSSLEEERGYCCLFQEYSQAASMFDYCRAEETGKPQTKNEADRPGKGFLGCFWLSGVKEWV
jgi:hypothetical protein